MATDYLVRASSLSGVRQTIQALGTDPEPLLQRAGLAHINPEEDTWMSYRTYLLLLEEASHVTQCPHFGLELSSNQDIGILGALGFVMQQAPDIGTALREFTRYFSYHNQGAQLELSVENGLATWRFRCKLEGQIPVRQEMELAVGLGLDLVRILWKPSWSPRGIYLSHSLVGDIRPYRERLSCPVHFDWDASMMCFDADLLAEPISEANTQLHQVLAQHLQSIQLSYPNDYPGQIRYLIQQAMAAGDCSIDRVASVLAVNKRTLQRRLSAHGTSYKDQLEAVRFDVARRYLRESNGSLANLADMLCYSELSAFSNAFRNRVGVSPRQWRQQVQQAERDKLTSFD